MSAVNVWRCAECGKWSHAKRKPSTHKRWVLTGTEVVEERDWETGAYYDVNVPAGEFKTCGPFAAWIATPAAARTAAAQLLRMEREHTGTGREGHLSETDLRPLLHALGIDTEREHDPNCHADERDHWTDCECWCHDTGEQP